MGEIYYIGARDHNNPADRSSLVVRITNESLYAVLQAKNPLEFTNVGSMGKATVLSPGQELGC